jgi:hypothetical protein
MVFSIPPYLNTSSSRGRDPGSDCGDSGQNLLEIGAVLRYSDQALMAEVR